MGYSIDGHGNLTNDSGESIKLKPGENLTDAIDRLKNNNESNSKSGHGSSSTPQYEIRVTDPKTGQTDVYPSNNPNFQPSTLSPNQQIVVKDTTTNKEYGQVGNTNYTIQNTQPYSNVLAAERSRQAYIKNIQDNLGHLTAGDIFPDKTKPINLQDPATQQAVREIVQADSYARKPQSLYNYDAYSNRGDLNGTGLSSGGNNSLRFGNTSVSLDNQKSVPMDQNQGTVKEVRYNNWWEEQVVDWRTKIDYLRMSNPLGAAALGYPLGFANTLYDTGKLGFDLVTSPIKTTKQLSSNIFSAVSHPVQTIKGIAGEADERPGEFLGGFTFDILAGKWSFELANKGTLMYRSITAPIRAGFEEIPAEQVLSRSVIAGEKFPTSPNSEHAFGKFIELGLQPDNSLLATNARPVAFPSVVAGGEKGAAAYEDLVTYTSPFTEGSPRFLRLQGTSYEGLSINPFEIKNPFNADPALNIIRAKGIDKIPQNIIDTARSGDFTKVNEWLSTQADKSVLYQTARSTLGHTSEMEAGIVPNAKAVVNSPFAFFKYEGKNVPVRLVDITEDGVETLTSSKSEKLTARQFFEDYESSNAVKSSYPPMLSPSFDSSSSLSSQYRRDISLSNSSSSRTYQGSTSSTYRNIPNSSTTTLHDALSSINESIVNTSPAYNRNSKSSKVGSQGTTVMSYSDAVSAPSLSNISSTKPSQPNSSFPVKNPASMISSPPSTPPFIFQDHPDRRREFDISKELKPKNAKKKSKELYGYSPSARDVSEWNVQKRVNTKSVFYESGMGSRPVPLDSIKNIKKFNISGI